MADASLLGRLPKVDRVLDQDPLAGFDARRELKRLAVGAVLDRLRQRVRDGTTDEVPAAAGVAELAHRLLTSWLTPGPVRVVNATGVLLHTNLGRAPLSPLAVEAMAAAAGYCDLEVSLDSGRRGSRFARLRPFLGAVLGAEDVHVVNNNAAGLLLACTALAAGGGVALSRGQMIEIGDGFRVATMAGAGGCRVWEVGSTNRTHRADYEAALSGAAPGMDGTPVSALLWVHLSNFRQDGFVREVDLPAMAELARAHGVPLIADLGSGSMGADISGDEPTIASYLASGANLVLASGDKLLGGPQAGLIAGEAKLVERCRRHPMARALRPDKTTIAALHATVVAHARDGVPHLPLHQMAGASVEVLRRRAAGIREALGWGPEVVVDSVATVGGGSLPGDHLDSVALAVPGARPSRLARALRMGNPPVVGHIEQDRLLLDLRTVAPEEDQDLIAALRALSSEP